MNQKKTQAIYPLSPSQQGMLFETLAAAEGGIFVEQSVSNLRGDLDRTAFERAWQRLAERHPILRTCFVWKNLDEPLQAVLGRVVVPLDVQDWRGLGPVQQQERLGAYLRTNRLRGFEFTTAPLMRLALFQVDDRIHQMVWTIHHILMDGWCRPLILNEFLALYEALRRGQDVPSTPGRPYRDYINWLKQQDLFQARAFWQAKLEGFSEPTRPGVEIERGPLPGQQEQYVERRASLPASVTTAVQSLARQHRLTLNTLVQGVWATLLGRYSGRSDVVYGITVSGRPPDLDGVESTIGLFINTVPLRIVIPPQSSLWPWLVDIQAQQFEQRAYEYCSTGQIHQWSLMPGALPLFETILVFQNRPASSSSPQTSAPSIEMDHVLAVGAQTRYALVLMVIPGPELEFKIVYDSYRLDDAGVTQILGHFTDTLQRIVADPEQTLVTLMEAIPPAEIPGVRSAKGHARRKPGDPFVAPRTDMERAIAGVWQNVLGVERVGLRDTLPDLGGHSLAVMQVKARLEQETGVRFQPGDLIHQTLEQLASGCEGRMPARQGSESIGRAQKLWRGIKNAASRRSDGRG